MDVILCKNTHEYIGNMNSSRLIRMLQGDVGNRYGFPAAIITLSTPKRQAS